MIVGILQLELRMSGCHSLKEKRMILKSLKDRLRQKFNISISEIGLQDAWQGAVLGMAAIGTDKGYVEGLLSSILNWVEADHSAELVSSHTEIL